MTASCSRSEFTNAIVIGGYCLLSREHKRIGQYLYKFCRLAQAQYRENGFIASLQYGLSYTIMTNRSTNTMRSKRN